MLRILSLQLSSPRQLKIFKLKSRSHRACDQGVPSVPHAWPTFRDLGMLRDLGAKPAPRADHRLKHLARLSITP